MIQSQKSESEVAQILSSTLKIVAETTGCAVSPEIVSRVAVELMAEKIEKLIRDRLIDLHPSSLSQLAVIAEKQYQDGALTEPSEDTALEMVHATESTDSKNVAKAVARQQRKKRVSESKH